MKDKVKYDDNLWFEHEGCEGKHYLIGNPHTFYGRMWAWCPKEERTLFVSKSEIGARSEHTEYWIQGFLHGNQPGPPKNEDGTADFDNETWIEAVDLFIETGYWWSGEERKCEMCGAGLLASEVKHICRDCQKKKIVAKKKLRRNYHWEIPLNLKWFDKKVVFSHQ